MIELEKPSKWDVLILKGRVGLSLVIRVLACFVGAYFITSKLSLNIVGEILLSFTLGGYLFWFTGRPYSETGVQRYKILWQVVFKAKKRYIMPPEFMNETIIVKEKGRYHSQGGRR
ncbi:MULTISPECIES: hypothetical protein [Lactococcus]|uniref:hypothetical protein n=1 Tax=Lactococcus TaxID=1357 RepID=UPI0020786222|nr:hypothetical protein [Lactococcus petauri]USI65305.1 hypothetical protein LMK05_10835 [Lactococcus petauri]USI67800.1 hypothetical protein LMK04_10070 [Lactococcus petauri]WJE12461.1 hypothetical protein QR692_09950 [Lactococcus petauri]